jgi:hypothetical protein
MTAVLDNIRFSVDCQSEVSEGRVHCVGHFTCTISLPSVGSAVPNHVVRAIEQAGQQFKREVAISSLEAIDQSLACLAQAVGHLRHHGRRRFTFLTPLGRVPVRRTRLFDPKTGTTLIPSAIAWQTQQNRHPVSSLITAACDVSQELSYRKSQEQLSTTAGVDSLCSASCVWNYKQKQEKELELAQEE